MDVSEFNQWADGNPFTLLSVTPDDTGELKLFVAYWLEPDIGQPCFTSRSTAPARYF